MVNSEGSRGVSGTYTETVYYGVKIGEEELEGMQREESVWKIKGKEYIRIDGKWYQILFRGEMPWLKIEGLVKIIVKSSGRVSTLLG